MTTGFCGDSAQVGLMTSGSGSSSAYSAMELSSCDLEQVDRHSERPFILDVLPIC